GVWCVVSGVCTDTTHQKPDTTTHVTRSQSGSLRGGLREDGGGGLKPRKGSKCLSLSYRNCWKQVCISAIRPAAGIPRCGGSSSPNAPASTSSICRRRCASSRPHRSCCATSC